MKNNRKHLGTLTVEVITSLFLLILLTAALATATRFYGYYNRLQLARQQCLAASQAQLDSIMIQKTLLSQQDIKRLWPGVKCTVEKQPGQGQWKGLDLYTATATAKVRTREVSVQMKRYLQSEE